MTNGNVTILKNTLSAVSAAAGLAGLIFPPAILLSGAAGAGVFAMNCNEAGGIQNMSGQAIAMQGLDTVSCAFAPLKIGGMMFKVARTGIDVTGRVVDACYATQGIRDIKEHGFSLASASSILAACTGFGGNATRTTMSAATGIVGAAATAEYMVAPAPAEIVPEVTAPEPFQTLASTDTAATQDAATQKFAAAFFGMVVNLMTKSTTQTEASPSSRPETGELPVHLVIGTTRNIAIA